MNRNRNGSNWRNGARLLLGAVLVMTGTAQGMQGQDADQQKPCPVKTPPPPESYATVYLKNVSQVQDANDLQTAVRNMVTRARVYYDPTANAIVMKGSADELALAQKVIADLDLAKKAYRLEYTVRMMDGAKPASTQHYALIVVLGERGQLKLGNKVPLMTGSREPDAGAASSQVQYIDVGLSISATLTGSGDDLILRTKVEQSTLADEKSAGGPMDPVMHQAVLEETARIAQGKPLTVGSLEIPGGANRLEVEVVVEGVK